MLRAKFDEISNREHWINQSEVRDQTNELVDLTGATIVTQVRDKDSKRVMLSATTANGAIAIEGLGIFTHTFTDQQMRTLDASFSYEIGCTIALDGIVHQFYVGTVAVIDGIVE